MNLCIGQSFIMEVLTMLVIFLNMSSQFKTLGLFLSHVTIELIRALGKMKPIPTVLVFHRANTEINNQSDLHSNL